MYSWLDDIDVMHGFLIVKTYAQLYLDYVGRYQLNHDLYAVPRIDKGADESPIQYRGLDRDALDDFDKSELTAEVAMALLNLEKKCFEGFIFGESDANDVRGMLPDPEQFEVIWTKLENCAQGSPDGFVSAGFEPTYFLSDHFSASCDCMLIPRWHGTDEEGTLFLEHFRKLNKYGLFSSAADASAFLQYYLTFDWTETGDYAVAEVFIKE